MKNFKLLLFACAVFLVFGACGNGQNQKEKEDATEVTTMTPSTDLAFFDLQGPVKSCDGAEFDRSGRVVTMDGIDPFAIDGPYRDIDSTGEFAESCQWMRDDEDKISSVLCVEAINNYVWKDGRVVGENGSGEGIDWVIEYQFSPEGRLMKTDTYYLDEEGTRELSGVTEYEYLEFDGHGNWTRRNVKYQDVMIDYNYEHEETRTIEYYE